MQGIAITQTPFFVDLVKFNTAQIVFKVIKKTFARKPTKHVPEQRRGL